MGSPPNSPNVELAITNIAAEYGIDRNALETVVQNESHGNPYVGYDPTHTTTGITQMNRGDWAFYGNGRPYEWLEDPANYAAQIEATAKFLKVLHHEYGTWKLAEEGYNEGETVMNKVVHHKRKLSPITERYASRTYN